MNNYRKDIEELLLSCYLNQDRTNELDKMEFNDYIIPYELFKATRTNKLIAKAIFVLQENKMPISEITVINFIQEKTQINEVEVLEVLGSLWCTFDTFLKYIQVLKDLDKEFKRKSMLEDL